ncbi:hypothetical protein RSOCI_04060 [Rhabdochlamydiaceae symbiont of Dictyostelium giganteum]
MSISSNILTTAGLTKIQIPSSDSSSDKIRLYFFSDPTPEGVAKVQTLFELEMKGKIYEGMINQMFKDIQVRPYLLKGRKIFKLIAKEHVFQLDEVSAYQNQGDTYHASKEYSEAITCYKKYLEIVIQLKDRIREGRCYSNLGRAYKYLGDYPQAMQFHERALKIARELKDQEGEGIAYCNLGNVYHLLREHDQAIDFHNKHLAIAVDLQDREGEGRAYGNLGKSYASLKDSLKSVEYHNKALIITQEFKDRAGEGKTHSCLGMAYTFLGEYLKAIEHHERCLVIARELKDEEGEGKAYCNLANVYKSLGEPRRAIEFHEQELKIALKRGDHIAERRSYNNWGVAYESLKEYSKAIHYYNQVLKIAQELKDQQGEGEAYGNLGYICTILRLYPDATMYYKKALKRALERKDRLTEGVVYAGLGNVYGALNDYRAAIKFHNKALAIVRQLKNPAEERNCYNRLGNLYHHLKQYKRAEAYFQKSIHINAVLQQNVKKSQWQITLFEELSSSYLSLEKALLCQDKIIEALEISDSRRARALASLTLEKFPLEVPKTSSLAPLTYKEMKDLAEKLHTTFIIYSLVNFDKDPSIQAWIVSPNPNQERTLIYLPSRLDEFKDINTILSTFPYGPRPKAERGIKATDPFKKHLSYWYELFIAPLTPYLSGAGLNQSLTFIPDRVLAHLPFGAFYHAATDQYLIEKHPISVAPSIKVLSLLDKLPKSSASQALIMGHSIGSIEADNQLRFTQLEVAEIKNIFHQKIASEIPLKTQMFTEALATADTLLKEAPLSQFIHIAGHGVMEEITQDSLDPHSVFKGLFKLAKDDHHPLGQLHSKEIATMTLKAELVFMSACHLGRGNLKMEGSIGPIWSFLGAGAKSTIASYWPLPDSQVTVKMVKTFYQHYLGVETPRLSKAHALREAILIGMQENRDNIEQWGAFFLSGLMN